MPRKQPEAPRKQASTANDDDATQSYLDNFLQSVTEDNNVPGDLKRNLGQMRELDQQAQELFERMQRLSKNHISKTKKAVQDGREPDEDFLGKARKVYRELMDVDEEKALLIDQMHADISRHFEHCASELRKFEEELREKGQLKTPQHTKTAAAAAALSRQDSAGSAEPTDGAGAAAGAAGAASSSEAMPPPPGTAGRRGRGLSTGMEPPLAPQSSNSHKRGRGRKVSFKEAERQRLASEAAAAAAAAESSQAAADATARAMGTTFNYPDPTLPLASRDDSSGPLCGAVKAAPDYIIPEGAKVCAKPPSNKMQAQDWILGTVLRFLPQQTKYIILDEDDSETDPWAAPDTQRQHTVPSRFVMPLPLSEPSVYTRQNEFQRGTWILALYPDTTCFYKALVHTPPSMIGTAPPRDYLVEFEDESEASGKSEPMRVPQKYVLSLQ